MKLTSILTGYFKTDGGGMYGVIPKIMWQKITPADQNNYIRVAMRSLLINTGDRIILIDTGAGENHSEKMQKIYGFHGEESLKSSLNKAGYQLTDITDVIITHLHYDHSGGLFDQQNKPVLPNATIHIGQKQWENANNPNPREKAAFDKEILNNIKAYPKVNFIKEEGYLFDNIYIKIFNGHTKGLVVPVITHGSKKIVFASDLIPTAAHVYEPYIASFDMCAEKVLEEKVSLYKEILQYDHCVFFEHDILNECGKVTDTEKGHKTSELYTLTEFLER